MSIRTRTTAAMLAAAAAIAAATAIPGLTGAQTTGEREITVRMKVRSGAQIQHRKNASRPSRRDDNRISAAWLGSERPRSLGRTPRNTRESIAACARRRQDRAQVVRLRPNGRDVRPGGGGS
jgi:hypothetical protein